MSLTLLRLLTTCSVALVATGNGAHSTSIYTVEAENDEIINLPGLDYSPGFKMFSGYLKLGENEKEKEVENDRFIFYWYAESQNNPPSDPFVYWTNGGPGCSGLSGFGYTQGPFLIDKSGKLNENKYSWNKNANMLYVEMPIGVGFSYSNQSVKNYTDFMVAQEQYDILEAFYHKFPHVKPNKLYLASEGYGGHYIPQLALYILEYAKDTSFNLKGIALGNPSVDFRLDETSMFQMLYVRGLIEENLYKSWWVNKCKTSYNRWVNFGQRGDCYEIEDQIWEELGEDFNFAALDYPLCKNKETMSTKEKQKSNNTFSTITSIENMSMMKKRRLLFATRINQKRNLRRRKRYSSTNYDPCREQHFVDYLNRPDVQNAIHATYGKVNSNSSIFMKWEACNREIFESFSEQDYYANYRPLYQQLVNNNERYNLDILIFSGDNDSISPYGGTSRWVHRLGLDPQVNDYIWNNEWIVNNKEAGFITPFNIRTGSFVFVVINDAGLKVAWQKPAQAFDMWNRFLAQTWPNNQFFSE